MSEIKIKDPSLLFEEQLPEIVDTFIEGWYTSINKLLVLFENKSFRSNFLLNHQMEYREKFEFKQVTNDIIKMCENLNDLSFKFDEAADYNTKILKYPLNKIQHIRASEINQNLDEELESIKSILDKTKTKINKQMKDIKQNWQDELQENFSSNIEYFSNCITGLIDCCDKTQKQMKSSKR